jgi:hypothetical protein
LFIEEIDSQLAGKEGDVFNDGKSDSPLLIFGQLNDSGKKGLRQELDANDIVNQFQFGDDMQPDIWEFVFEHLEEHRQKVGDGFFLPKNWRKTANLSSQSRPYVLRLIRDEIFHTRHYFVKQGFPINQRAESCLTVSDLDRESWPRISNGVTWYLAGNGSADFSLSIFQKFDK